MEEQHKVRKRPNERHDTDVANRLGEYIKARRIELGYDSQRKFAIALGYTAPTVNAIEQGRSRPSMELLNEIAKVLRVDVGVLFAMYQESEITAEGADNDVRRAVRNHPYLDPTFKDVINAIIDLAAAKRTVPANQPRVAEPRQLYKTAPPDVIAAAGDTTDLDLPNNKKILDDLKNEDD